MYICMYTHTYTHTHAHTHTNVHTYIFNILPLENNKSEARVNEEDVDATARKENRIA